jgi:hypothetical protein
VSTVNIDQRAAKAASPDVMMPGFDRPDTA